MRQCLDDLRASQTARDSTAQIHIELVVVARRGERGDGHEAAISDTELGLPPQSLEDHVVGQLDELRRDGPQFGPRRCRARRLDAGTGSHGLTALRVLASMFRALYTWSYTSSAETALGQPQ